MSDTMIHAALYGASAALPHLSGLARLVMPRAEPRIPTAAVAASGRLLVNPSWFATLTFAERVFVMAHELMHLALRSHARCTGSDARLFNVAHDLIINDMLVKALGMPAPADGLYERDASVSSAERIVTELRRREALGGPALRAAWRKPRAANIGALGAALVAAGRGEAPKPDEEQELLDPAAERRLFPDSAENEVVAARIAAEGERSLALEVFQARAKAAFDAAAGVGAGGAGPTSGLWQVLSTYHTPPWESALQRWLDDATPSGRTYRRCSRRQGDRTDIVLPGHAREGWTLNVVLDTSGSMSGPLSRALGSLKSFCMSANVARVRIVQGDVAVKADDTLDVRDIDVYRISGGGGSDMGPGMRWLAADAEVEAVVVITDGWIDYPPEPMPYDVLWALTEEPAPGSFEPAYGRIVVIRDQGSDARDQ